MANRERGEMILATSTHTYTMRLTTNACADLEDRSGKLVDDVVRGAYRGSVRDLRWLLWAALQDKHADTVIEPQDAGRIIDDAGGIQGMLAQLVAFMKMNSDSSAPEGQVTSAAAGERPIAAQATAGSGVGSTSTPVVSA
jgi:hypothetical protein